MGLGQKAQSIMAISRDPANLYGHKDNPMLILLGSQRGRFLWQNINLGNNRTICVETVLHTLPKALRHSSRRRIRERLRNQIQELTSRVLLVPRSPLDELGVTNPAGNFDGAAGSLYSTVENIFPHSDDVSDADNDLDPLIEFQDASQAELLPAQPSLDATHLTFMAKVDSVLEPTTYYEASQDPKWVAAMNDELDALHRAAEGRASSRLTLDLQDQVKPRW
ncbi:hypothetical protein M569_15014, partial [Genlisea aurea]